MSDHEAADSPADAPRGLVRYGPEGPELVRDPTVDRSVEVAPGAVDVFRTVTGERFSDDAYGSHRASVHLFEDVTVVHVPEGPDRGVVATFDAAAADRPIGRLLATVAEVTDG
ncbi:hypothetical protein [Halovivax sp.]|uniref:hypothetical protein n=1 Tax=Halovivax sp. TaxID=1935978 RepID=UPI0025BCE235|nr:hypothetical protein [Halovivax sp.]